MNNFVDLLRRAAALWWRTRILWPLGMLAALFGSGDLAVNGNVNVQQRVFVSDPAAMPPWLDDLAESPLLRSFVDNPWPYVIGFLLLAAGLGLIGMLVGVIAHGAMIRVADMADQGYQASIGDGLRTGAARAMPLFLLNLIVTLPLIVGVAIVTGMIAMVVLGVLRAAIGGSELDPAPLFASALGTIFCSIGIIILISIISVVLGVLLRVAQRVCVIEARGPLESLGRGWALIRQNLGLTLLTWLLQAVLGGLTSFILSLPAVGMGLSVTFTILQGGAFPVGLVIALVLYALFVNVVAGGLLTAFNSALWTVMYRAFAGHERPPESYAPA